MEGIKHDQDKLPWELLPWDAVREVVRVLQFGKQKYSARNWERGIAYSRLYAAAVRHLSSWFQDGEDKDPETGISHLAHASCCVLFMLAFHVRGNKDVDDRPTQPAEKKPARRYIAPGELLDGSKDLIGLRVLCKYDLGDGILHMHGTIWEARDGVLYVRGDSGELIRQSVVEMEVVSE